MPAKRRQALRWLTTGHERPIRTTGSGRLMLALGWSQSVPCHVWPSRCPARTEPPQRGRHHLIRYLIRHLIHRSTALVPCLNPALAARRLAARRANSLPAAAKASARTPAPASPTRRSSSDDGQSDAAAREIVPGKSKNGLGLRRQETWAQPVISGRAGNTVQATQPKHHRASP